MQDDRIAAARDYGQRFKAKQVIILYISETSKFGYASWGKTQDLCRETKRLADVAYNAISDAIMDDNKDDEWQEWID